VRILVFFTSSVLPVRLSRAYTRHGEEALRKRVRLSLLIVAPVFAAYCLLVTLLAGPLIRLLYGESYSNVTRVVGIFALGTFAIELAGLISNGLEVQRQTPAIFIGGLGSSVVAVAVGWFLIELFGVDGAALTMVLAGVITSAVFWYVYRRGEAPSPTADRSEIMDISLQSLRPKPDERGRLEPMRLPPLPERPLVSIIMPNYNYADFIGLAIESALSQTYDNLELLVVDDCSTDNSRDVIAGYARRDSRLRAIWHESNQGHQTVLGTGFAASRGEIICLLDSDDVFMPDKVESVVRRFQELPNAGFLVHRAMVVDSDGRPVQVVPLIGRLQEGWLASYLMDHGGGWRDMATSALSFRREVGQLALPIPPTGLRASGDCYCFTIMPMLTEVAAIDRPLNLWRIHGGNGYGTFELTLALIEGDLRYTEGNWKAVNQRLVELGFPERRLDRDRHLHFHRRTFERRLILGEPRIKLAAAYLRLAPKIVKSDLSGTAGKGIRLLGYGLAIPLPMFVRRRWLNLIFGKSRARQRAATIVRFMARSRPLPAAPRGVAHGRPTPDLVNSSGQTR
ncbi:MAG TPA: glycosyltransferase, partial [Thermomicrobiaceae bacterium]|nr:glycosyltransferase [Thermomicrobiaceae bacterium]